MKLFFRKFGENKPQLIIVHGLYGMSDNWVTIAKALSSNFEVFVIDQRNHGNSPHSEKHNYFLLQNDLYEFMQDQKIEKAILLGHSMGGKTVMNFANYHHEMILALIVVDIAPIRYNDKQLEISRNKHLHILNVMQKLNFAGISKREEIRNIVTQNLKEKRITDFILKNLKRINKEFQWKLNINGIINNIDNIIANLNLRNGITGFPCLFIKGEKSDYILKEDISHIINIFPVSEIVSIKNAGHWIHSEKPNEFIELVVGFLEDDLCLS